MKTFARSFEEEGKTMAGDVRVGFGEVVKDRKSETQYIHTKKASQRACASRTTRERIMPSELTTTTLQMIIFDTTVRVHNNNSPTNKRFANQNR
jgi:hypothetical protein